MPIRFILVLAGALLLAIPADAALFGNRTTREYRKLRAEAQDAEKAGRHDEQLRKLEAAHQVISKDADNRHFIESLFDLGEYCARHGIWWRAEDWFRRAKDRAIAVHGTNHLDAARVMFSHARCLIELHRFAEAGREMEMVESTARGKAGRHSVAAGYCKAVLGQINVLQGRIAEAIPILEDGLHQMGWLRSFTNLSAVTSGVISNGHGPPGPSTEICQPAQKDIATVLIDYAIALRAAGRDADAEVALGRARDILVLKMRHPLPEFFIKNRFSEAAEAAGDLKAAERHMYEGVAAAYANKTATPGQKQIANHAVLGFHIRNGHGTKASVMEGILLQQGLTLDELDPFNTLQMQMREERMKAKEAAASAGGAP